MIWRTRSREHDLSRHALVIGIVNVTADSFSDGGKFLAPEAAVAHALTLAGEGARILDIGGESTRPGAEPVSAQEEMARVLPVIERLAAALRGRNIEAEISIDTSKAAVARAAIERGAGIINDVTGLRGDMEMPRVARETGAGVIAMHMQGTPRDMQRAPHYENVTAEVREFFRQTFSRAVASGIPSQALAFDPGIGFGKTLMHNLSLLQNLAALRVEERPLVLGVSRKSFLGKVIGSEAMADRAVPTAALTALGRERGANVFRVHDVRANVHALRISEALLTAP